MIDDPKSTYQAIGKIHLMRSLPELVAFAAKKYNSNIAIEDKEKNYVYRNLFRSKKSCKIFNQ